MKTKPKTLMLLLLITISFLSAKPAHAASLSDEGRINPAPPTDAKGSLISDMPPGTAMLCDYSLVSYPMSSGATPVPSEEPTAEATPRPPTDTYLEPPQVITAQAPEKEFFVIKTRNEKIFYLIIDRSMMSENVYLVTEVDEEDLLNFVQATDSPSLLPFLQPSRPTATPQPTPEPSNGKPPQQSAFSLPINSGMAIAGAVLLLLAGGAFFYWKVIKPKEHTPSEGDFFEDDFLEKSTTDDNEDDE